METFLAVCLTAACAFGLYQNVQLHRRTRERDGAARSLAEARELYRKVNAVNVEMFSEIVRLRLKCGEPAGGRVSG